MFALGGNTEELKAVDLLTFLDIPVMQLAFLAPRFYIEKQGIIKLIDLCLSLIQVAFISVSLNLAFSFSFGATEISPSRESKLLDLSFGSRCLHSMNKIYCPLSKLFWWF